MTSKVDKKEYSKKQAAAQAERKAAEKAARDGTPSPVTTETPINSPSVDATPTSVTAETPINSPRVDATATPQAGNSPVQSKAQKRAERRDALFNARKETLNEFDQLLNALDQEVNRLKNVEDHSFTSFDQNSAEAALAGRRLHNGLVNLKNTFITDITLNAVEDFKSACNGLITEAMDTEQLVKQPFWPEFLYNFLFVVSNILTLGLASGISYLATDDLRFFKVPEKETLGLINALQETVNAVPSN